MTSDNFQTDFQLYTPELDSYQNNISLSAHCNQLQVFIYSDLIMSISGGGEGRSLEELFLAADLDVRLLAGTGGTEPVNSENADDPDPSEGIWKLNRGGVLTGDENPRFDISHGLVRYEMFVSNGWLNVHWDSDIPGYLKPEGEDQLVDEFMPWMFHRLPQKLTMAQHNEAETLRMYRKFSQFEIEYFSGEKKELKTEGDKGLAHLATGFFNGSERVRRFRGQMHGDSENLRIFALTATYPETDFDRGQLALTIPINDRGINAWNPTSAIWMLETHRRGSALGDLASPGNRLAAELKSLTQSLKK